jgi:hypothetical protein
MFNLELHGNIIMLPILGTYFKSNICIVKDK